MIEIARQLLMAQLKAKRGHQKRIDAAIADGRCIHPHCQNKHQKRGLCETHYAQFYRGRMSQADEAARVEFEQDAIREGLVLPSGKQRSMTSDNLYSKLG